MSKHWKPRAVESGRARAPRRHGVRRGRRVSRISWAELRLVLTIGFAGGLAYTGYWRAEDAAVVIGGPAAAMRVDDPWAVTITDGDTFHYRGERVRIADIDTPEVRGRCAYEVRLAAQATERMEGLLRQAPFEMQPIPGRDEDQYGRKLRVILRDGRSLGDELVSEGLARTWKGQRRPWCE